MTKYEDNLQRWLEERQRIAELRFMYGTTQEEIEANAKWDRESRCKPCCDKHTIRYGKDGKFYLEVTMSLSESTNLEIEYCPSCGKKQERAE